MTVKELLLQRAREVSQSPASAPVPSPCISVCRINAERGQCEGCLRTLDEIAVWSRANDTSKRAVWRLLGERAAALD